jgi:uncharacterized membrane protein
MYNRINHFLKVTLMGGLVVLLPSFLLVNIALWLFGILHDSTKPVVSFISEDFHLSLFLSQLIVLALITAICFVTGILVRNRLGAILIQGTEKAILNRFPGYVTLKELVGYFFSTEKKSAFSQPVLVSPWGNEIWLTGFYIEKSSPTHSTVFVPTAPNPSSGFILHVPDDRIRMVSTSSSEAFKTVIGCGSGSSVLFK